MSPYYGAGSAINFHFFMLFSPSVSIIIINHLPYFSKIDYVFIFYTYFSISFSWWRTIKKLLLLIQLLFHILSKGRDQEKIYNLCCYSVTQLCLTLSDPLDCSMPGLPVCHCHPEFTETHVRRAGDAIQPAPSLLSLSLLPSIFPGIRVFSNELALPIRRPKYE